VPAVVGDGVSDAVPAVGVATAADGTGDGVAGGTWGVIGAGVNADPQAPTSSPTMAIVTSRDREACNPGPSERSCQRDVHGALVLRPRRVGFPT
jgi:hypothetical protein